MTPIDRFERQLPDGLADLAGARVPSYLDDILAETGRTRQRPAWTFIERWLPMSLITARPATAPPMRAAWILVLTGLLIAALVAGMVIVGSQLLNQDDPNSLFAGNLVPTLELDTTWDSTTISGLSVPAGIDVGPDGNIYVVSAGSHEIIVIDPAGREVRRWGEKGRGDGQFLFHRHADDPIDLLGGVAVGPDGSVYVADMVNDRVQQFSTDGTFVRAWGGHGPGDGQFLEPFDVAVGPDGSVYVVDDLRDDIQRFSAEGAWLQTVGRHGSAGGEMDNTSGIAVGPDGMLLNADSGNARVQAWDDLGTFLWSRGGSAQPGTFAGLVDIAADTKGSVYVADEEGIKAFGDGPEQLSASTPPGWMFGWLAASDDGTLYASSTATDRIHRLAIEYREAETASASVEPSGSSPALAAAVSPDAGAPSPNPSTGAGGTEIVTIDSVFPVTFSAVLPSTIDAAVGYPGWRQDGVEPGYASFVYVRGADGTPAYVTLYIPAGVFRDPCHPEEGMLTTSVDPGVEELVEALTTQVGVRAGPVTEISFGSYGGKTFELENNIDATGCSDDPWLPQWTYRSAGPDNDEVTRSGGLSNTHQRIAIVDVGGTPVLIEAWELGAYRDEVVEVNQLFESIDFE